MVNSCLSSIISQSSARAGSWNTFWPKAKILVRGRDIPLKIETIGRISLHTAKQSQP